MLNITQAIEVLDREKINLDQVRQAVALFHEPGEAFEVSLVGQKDTPAQKRIYNAVFDNVDSFLCALATLISESRGKNPAFDFIYKYYNTFISPQRANPAIMSRATRNNFTNGAGRIKDGDIIRRTHIIIDLDPIRLDGTGATAEEHEHARKMAEEITQYLSAAKWGKPVRAMSGNGIHLIYKTDLEATPETQSTLTAFYNVLGVLFNNGLVDIDISMAKAPQPIKLYGTMARKGDNTDARPHRLAKIEEQPDELQTITLEQVKEIADKWAELNPTKEAAKRYPRKYEGQGSAADSVFWLECWLTAHGIPYKTTNTAAGVKYIVPCPWGDDITEEEKEGVLISSVTGTYSYTGVHNRTREKKWRDYRLYYEPDAYDKKPETEKTAAELQKERGDAAQNTLVSMTTGEPDTAPTFDRNEKGRILQTVNNVEIVLKNDKRIAGRIAYNEMGGRVWLRSQNGAPAPWRQKDGNLREWDDTDESFLLRFLEKNYGLNKPQSIKVAFDVVAKENAFNPVIELLRGTKWDGVPRIATMLHDCLGAQQSAYTAEIMKNVMLGAINRAVKPGCKYDHVLVLAGPQGCGKSSFISCLAMDDSYYTDSIKRLDDDRAAEKLRGKWFVEIAELLAVKKTKDVEAVKLFLTQRADTYRPAYAHNTINQGRTCVFIATTNSTDFLNDPTGARRWFPVDVTRGPHKIDIFDPNIMPDYIRQAWAEAMAIYDAGGYDLAKLTPAATKILEQARQDHTEEDPQAVTIAAYLEEHPELEEVCTALLYVEALGMNKADFLNDRREQRHINEIMRGFEGWTPAQGKKVFKKYNPGKVRYYIRAAPADPWRDPEEPTPFDK